ncbi:PREDICTED: tetranectin-like isoform X2 [Calidris pugnax]|uniref:tetranectin-like isoform X2 n=1 Tax=Calidris pugnax TaxID=198806 RepID=UPI00071E4793|nr:PREDICTED: tetranectin-like isoform X2 [Calidris pugnax]
MGLRGACLLLLLCLLSLAQVSNQQNGKVRQKPAASKKDGVNLKMIEDLKAMIDNISQEVALLKEKQALQTGKGLAEEGMAFALREELLIKRLQLLHTL